MVAFVALITVACLHGFGRYDLDIAAKAEMTFWRVVAQTVAMVATGTSKASVGLLLLRLVAKTWHKVFVWSVIVIMAILSLGVCDPLELVPQEDDTDARRYSVSDTHVGCLYASLVHVG